MNFAKSSARTVTLCAILLFLPPATLRASDQHVIPVSAWREDLQYLATEIEKVHPHPYHQISREQFKTAVSGVEAEIPDLSDHEIVIAFARLVAMLGEGHSRLSLPGLADPMSDVAELSPAKYADLQFHRLPLTLYWFSDGLFVVAATPEFHELVGARVVRIGSSPSQAALDAVQPIVSRDNEMGLRLVAPDLVVVPEVLQAMHIISNPSRVPLGLQTKDGKALDLDVAPLALAAQPALVEGFDPAHVSRPLYLQHEEKNFWTEYLATSRMLYVRVRVIQDAGGESVARFARQLGPSSASQPLDRMVIDLRGCHGGDNQLFRSLLLEIIRDTRINLPGKIFTVTDRGSFSAAVNAAADLEQLSNSLFVGEPASGAPSSWGDPRAITLPNSGLIARISTVYWRDSSPDPSRPWIAPDIPAPVSSANYFAGLDPAMEAILRFPLRTSFVDVVENAVRAGGGVQSIVRLYYRQKTDPAYADDSTEQAMQRLGKYLLSTRAYKEALLVFHLNFRDYPRSLSGAIKAVQTAQAANPNNDDLTSLARKLSDLGKAR